MEKLKRQGQADGGAGSPLPNLGRASSERREKSLAALAERFVQLFVVGAGSQDARTISLHSAAHALSSALKPTLLGTSQLC